MNSFKVSKEVLLQGIKDICRIKGIEKDEAFRKVKEYFPKIKF